MERLNLLQKKIETLREQLHNLVVIERRSLNCLEVCEISGELDRLIVEFQRYKISLEGIV